MNPPRKVPVAIPRLLRASHNSTDRIDLTLDQPFRTLPDPADFELSGGVEIRRISRGGPSRIVLWGGPWPVRSLMTVRHVNGDPLPVLPDGILDQYKPSSRMGVFPEGDGWSFCLFAPRAESVQVRFRHQPDEAPYEEMSLSLDSSDGCWRGYSTMPTPGDLVSYSVSGVPGNEENEGIEFADPCSWAVVKQDDWRRKSFSILLPWEQHNQPAVRHVGIEPLKRVIYEAHLKDVSRLNPSLPEHLRGTYRGAADANAGIGSHLKWLGCNTVEWLPLADYDHREPPFGEWAGDHMNTWNRYSFNHWGYMPAYFFAPEGRYAAGKDPSGWIGRDGRQVRQTRELIQSLHDQGISVFLDVVYNHIAQYGENPIRQIDPLYSLRHNGDGTRISDSFCGNDLDTSRPVIRTMVVESLRHWMNYYGVDGFRFDLAGIIDDETLDVISESLRSDYEDVQLIAEPWGQRYDKVRYAVRGWASWNDHYRDGILGHDPHHPHGVIFGDGIDRLTAHLTGSLKADGGPFDSPELTLNYIASHDGYTLGDFIRVAMGRTDQDPDVRRSPEVVERIKLGLLTLAVSRGPIMIQQGDEFGRCKCINSDEVEDPYLGQIDRDSYNKDDRTNWLDWKRFSDGLFHDLALYTKNLFEFRNSHPALTRTQRESAEELNCSSNKCRAYRLQAGRDAVVVILNYSPDEVKITLPTGRWMAHADGRHADARNAVAGAFLQRAIVPGWSGMILTPPETPES